MIRTSRLSHYLVGLILFLFLSIATLSRYQLRDPIPTSNPQSIPAGTNYLSWLPHGDITDQHEAFRNALRIGKALNRTVIAPKLRLGQPLHWQPFEELARSYTTLQDKEELRQRCQSTTIDQVVCLQKLNEWAEIPWSSLFDVKAITTEFGIPVIERTDGHGWGVNETAQGVMDTITDVVVLDAMTFIENATFYNDQDTEGWGDYLERQLSQYIVHQPKNSNIITNNNSTRSKPYLKTVIHAHQWKSLQHVQYIQFGALSSTPRYQVHTTDDQVNLRKALGQSLFVRPDQMVPLYQQADRAIKSLGGSNNFHSLRLDITKVIELDGRMNGKATIDDLDARSQQELMDMVVMEVFGDIPINQAVISALPVNTGSKLATLLSQQQQHILDRQQLLDACMDYRQQFENQYPIYYLVGDHILAPALRSGIYGPLLSHFPCLFTKEDLKLDLTSWISAHPALQDQNMNYGKILGPILDILIAGQGSSFIEVPLSPLTKFISRQQQISTDNNTVDSSPVV
ncbi:hypothetical protein BC941DRAFT_508327 [Chlamydoabsidia padenii]|nr:hypothetical protein BC941DRAFT_508327 [Chlamydoabsidia padenii]